MGGLVFEEKRIILLFINAIKVICDIVSVRVSRSVTYLSIVIVLHQGIVLSSYFFILLLDELAINVEDKPP